MSVNQWEITAYQNATLLISKQSRIFFKSIAYYSSVLFNFRDKNGEMCINGKISIYRIFLYQNLIVITGNVCIRALHDLLFFIFNLAHSFISM